MGNPEMLQQLPNRTLHLLNFIINPKDFTLKVVGLEQVLSLSLYHLLISFQVRKTECIL